MPENKPPAEQKTDAKILRASLRERIELLDRNPDRTRQDVRLANKLARQHTRLLMKY
jgi:hypothetical protein